MRPTNDDIAREVRDHLELEVEELMGRGMSPYEARNLARRKFGNVGLVLEDTRAAWGRAWLERMRQDIRFAFRWLVRAPVFALTAIATLALGIGANTAMLTVVRSVLLRPLPFHDPSRLYVISNVPAAAKPFTGPAMTDQEFADFRRSTHTFSSVMTYNAASVTLVGSGDAANIPVADVTPSFFDVLGVAPRIGRAFEERDGQPGSAPVAVISASLWASRFGSDPSVVGRSAELDGVPTRIVGVMPDAFRFPRRADIWVPLDSRPDPRGAHLRPVIGRLSARSTSSDARHELAAFARTGAQRGVPQGPEPALSEVIPLRDAVVGDVGGSLVLFSSAIGLVLLIAATNVSNLLLMRAAARRHELGIRRALGASRPRLAAQLLTESVVIAVLGGIAGLAVAQLGLRLLLSSAPADLLPRMTEIHLDPWVLGVTALICLGAGVLAGMAPALLESRRHGLQMGGTVRVTAQGRFRAAFVVIETSLALVLLIGAGLLGRSFLRLRDADLGFDPTGVVSATLVLPASRYRSPDAMHQAREALLARFAAIPTVQSVAATTTLPLAHGALMGAFAVDNGREIPPGYAVLKPAVTPSYFSTMGMRIQQGRSFTQSDVQGSAQVAIITKAIAKRFWPGESPIGKRIALTPTPGASDWLTVVGVVDDVPQSSPSAPRQPAVFRPLAQIDQPLFLGQLAFVARTNGDASAAAKAMREAVRTIDPQEPIESLATMDTRIADTITEPRFRSSLLLIFSIVAVILASIGLYGVLGYAVTERRREIGIRLALGGSRMHVIRGVVGETMSLVIPALGIGIAAAAASGRLLAKFLFQVQPTDITTFSVASGLLVAVALVAALGPARRASRVDPMIAMR
jgi:putative ABC transport system permease protein